MLHATNYTNTKHYCAFPLFSQLNLESVKRMVATRLLTDLSIFAAAPIVLVPTTVQFHTFAKAFAIVLVLVVVTVATMVRAKTTTKTCPTTRMAKTETAKNLPVASIGFITSREPLLFQRPWGRLSCVSG